MPRVKVYAVINQKGGVGKTTTVANLGAAIASLGHSVCLIDLDPQAHLTLHFAVEPGTPETSIYDVLTSDEPLSSAAMLVAPNLWIAPSTIDLAAAEIELVTTVGREQILRDRLGADDLPCEFAMIDCPPSLGLLTLNALAAADEVLIPLQPHFLALQGLGKLLETISLVQQRINPKLRVGGVIFCMYETSTRLAGEVADDVRKFFESARSGDMPWAQAKVFTTRIRRNIKLAECPSHGQTIFNYDAHCRGAEDYRALAEEFLALALGPAPEGEHPCDSGQADLPPVTVADQADAESAPPIDPQPDAAPGEAPESYASEPPAPRPIAQPLSAQIDVDESSPAATGQLDDSMGT